MIILRKERHHSPRMPYGWTREELRNLARVHGIPRGRNTTDTLKNLKKAGLIPL